MPSTVLYPVYLAVMGAAAACFGVAFLRRHHTPRHMRWALTGLGLDLGGTLVVLLLHRVLGWPMHVEHAGVVLWHRRLAYLSTALLLAVGLSGWKRLRIHPLLGTALLPIYATTLGLAIVGYWPY